MKVRILKPSNKSGYFKDDIVEFNNSDELTLLKSLNEIELLIEPYIEDIPVDVKVTGKIKKIK
jgi:hypothetical protein